jgi:hypothetical protein
MVLGGGFPGEGADGAVLTGVEGRFLGREGYSGVRG